MKRIFYLLFAASLLTGCIKNDPVIFADSLVEFDAASWNANAAGLTYPILTRVPREGAVTPTANATLTRATGMVTLRVNLVGAQKSTPINFTYSVIPAVSPAVSAVAGTHFTTLSGTGSIPANSSFGFITVPIINSGVSSATPVVLVLQLTTSVGIKASFNYDKVGLSIAQL